MMQCAECSGVPSHSAAKLVAGLDIGTTGCKVTVFAPDGTRLGREYRDYPVTRAVSAQEIDANAIASAIIDALKATTAAYGTISGIGVTSFGEAFVLTDGNGVPLRPIMLGTDARGKEECTEFAELFGGAELRRITGVKPNETFSLPKLLWIKKHEPELYAKAKFAMLIEDFAIYTLTGKRVIDYSLAARAMAFDIRELAWSKPILDAADIPVDMFSTPVPTGSIAGTVCEKAAAATGLSVDTMVIAAGHDQVACAVGSGVFKPGVAVDGSGTVECITPVYANIPKCSKFMDDNYCIVPYFGNYVAYAYSYTGGELLRWCSQKICREDHATLQAGDYSPTGLLALPHFAGAGTPYMDSGAKGAIVGLTLETDARDLYLACMEGVAYEMRVNVERLASSGVTFNRLVATGGGAKSKLWTQMKADILGIPFDTLETEDAGTVGSAIMTGLAVGTFACMDDAVRIMVKKTGEFTPRPEFNKIYSAIYSRYAKLYDAVRPLEG